MRPDDEIGEAFRTATSGLSGEPIRWERVSPSPPPRIPKRRYVIVAIAALTIAIAVGAILAKASLDPAYRHALTRSASVRFEPGHQVVTFEPYGKWLREVRAPTEGRARRELAQRGVTVRVQFELNGFKGKRLRVRWTLVDLRTETARNAKSGLMLTAEAEHDRATWPMWTAVPRQGGRFYLRVELLEERMDVPLAVANTRQFVVRPQSRR
jgi:hypothetical protein